MKRFHFSRQLKTQLKDIGIGKVRDIIKIAKNKSFYSKYFGQNSINEIEDAFKRFGIPLPENQNEKSDS